MLLLSNWQLALAILGLRAIYIWQPVVLGVDDNNSSWDIETNHKLLVFCREDVTIIVHLTMPYNSKCKMPNYNNEHTRT